MCAALDRDGGKLFRQQVATINPDASILKGPYNDEDRAMVGLSASWYDPKKWPEQDQQRLLQERYLSGPSYSVLEEPVLSQADLTLLRERIFLFCEAEEQLAAVETCA